MEIPAHRYPWSWSYAIFLERRWEQVQEISSMYGDDKGTGDDKEIPKEYWHDQKRVDEWIDRRKKRREEEQNSK